MTSDRQTPAAANDRRRERLPDGQAHDRVERARDRPRGPLPTRVEGLPELPAAYVDALDAGLASLDLRLAGAARSMIDAHVRLLIAWTGAINLTAIREPAEIARLHVIDSLSAAPLLAGLGIGRFVDLGSGGGYPGLPLAAALGAERVLLIDSVAKKVRFLRTVIEATGLDRQVVAEPDRAEAVARDPRDRETWPAVTARAVAPLAELVELALPLLAPDGVLVAWKRAPVEAELAGAGGALRALRAGPVRVLAPDVPGLEAHRLVVVSRAGPIDPQFPRDPAERRRRPL